jgi:hypothetical protein
MLAALLLRLLVVVAHVEHHDPLVEPDLRRRETDARRRVHRLGHVLDDLRRLAGDVLHRTGRAAQGRLGKREDATDGHGKGWRTGGRGSATNLITC